MLRLHDPGLQSLRRAARVAIVVPVVFAIFLEGFDNSTAALFAGFGSFALLGFADFGGPPRARGGAYLTLTAVGAVLVVMGTLVCNQPVVAAIVAVAVAGSARFAGCFGGYFAASVSPVILAYVLAASVPAPIDATPDRLLGWCVAGMVATVAGLVLWPRRQRMLIREAAGHAAAAVADAIEAGVDDTDPKASVLDVMDAAVAKLLTAASVPRRPVGPSAHDAALALLIDQILRAAGLVRAGWLRVGSGEQARQLEAVATSSFRTIDAVLASGAPPDDLDARVAACIDAKQAALAHTVDELHGGAAADTVLEEIDARFTERQLLLVAASALANAAIVVCGRGPSDAAAAIPLDVPADATVRGAMGRLRHLVQANAVSTSAWAQESVRAGIAVGAAVLIAGVLDLDHGFWVVLGTLSVLRSNAFDTSRNALMAALGTAIGFAISAALLAIVGFDDVGLWIIVVAGFFLSAYTPQVVGFVAGQVCFTIAVVAMFNLIIPQGWHTGLVRLENIIIGSSVSLVVALLFWPRRALVGLRGNLAGLFQNLGNALTTGIDQAESYDAVRRSELRVHASYVQYLSETARTPEGREPWAALVTDAAQVRFVLAALERHRGITRFDACAPTRSALRDAVRNVSRSLDDTATQLERPGQADAANRTDVAALRVSTRAPIAECLGRHAHEAGPDGPLAAGLDAAIVRDLLIEVALVADDALDTVPKVSQH